MEKKIDSFFMSSAGFGIDLGGIPAATIVTPNDGTILLNEGFGKGRVPRAAIPGDKVVGFLIEIDEKKCSTVVVQFRRENKVDRHIVGRTDDHLSAQAWVDRVNLLYKKK